MYRHIFHEDEKGKTEVEKKNIYIYTSRTPEGSKLVTRVILIFLDQENVWMGLLPDKDFSEAMGGKKKREGALPLLFAPHVE